MAQTCSKHGVRPDGVSCGGCLDDAGRAMAERLAHPEALKVERVVEPSHVRRGRLATSPVWYAESCSGERRRFQRKKDAVRFALVGCPDAAHTSWAWCGYCNSTPLSPPPPVGKKGAVKE